jgi:hypothetical protein
MGGLGSGSCSRWNSKTTTESQHRIDIRWLKKHGYLRPGNIGTLSWSQRGKETGSIIYRMEIGSMILNYRYRYRDGEWQAVEQDIHFNRTPCNYGGHRWWFLCLGVPAGWPFYMVLENISFVGIAMDLHTQASRKACLTVLCGSPEKYENSWAEEIV